MTWFHDDAATQIIASVSYDKEYWVNEVAWHSKDSLLMCAGRQKADVQEKGVVQLIQVDWAGGGEAGGLKSVASVVAHTANCTNLVMDRQRHHFATGAYDGTVCLWDSQHLACLRPACTSLEEGVGCLSFSHDGTFIAATVLSPQPSSAPSSVPNPSRVRCALFLVRFLLPSIPHTPSHTSLLHTFHLQHAILTSSLSFPPLLFLISYFQFGVR
jgi:WD40 repeat protein